MAGLSGNGNHSAPRTLYYMPLFYLDFRDGDRLIVDDEGVNLPDLEAVQEEASRALSGLAWGAVKEFGRISRCSLMTVEVRDELGPVMKVGFSFTIDRKQ